MRRFPQRMWWFEPKQNVHYDVVEGDVWRTTPNMLDRKDPKSYKLSFLAFEHLVSELTSFLRPTTNIFVRPLVHIGKQLSLVVYRLAQSLTCKAMNVESLPLENTRLLFAKYFLLRMDCSEDIFMHILDIDQPIPSVSFVKKSGWLT